ncbi:MAG: M28 family metallopeptidase [Pseudomonadota bacterium]
MRLAKLLIAATVLAFAGCAPPPAAPAPTGNDLAAFTHPPLSADALMSHVRVLSSDEFEGRAVGSHGEELSLAYITRAFQRAGLQPGGENGGWLQRVPLVSAAVEGAPALTISGRDGAHTYAWGAQYVAWSKRVQPEVSVTNAPLVFVGYGVVAPERHWNDYAGVDMHGKIAVMLINDPDFETPQDLGFGGHAMTLYGRWTYKFEEAARQGAAGAIIIHETAPAAYGWGVVQSSNTGAKFDTVREDHGASRAAFEGWVTTDVGQELLRHAGQDFATLKARAQTPGFRAVPLNLTGSLDLHISTHEQVTYNVVGRLLGRTHPDEAIFYSAHWDHLGHCTPVNGDGICNGALDNASGVAGLIELARQFKHDGTPARSVYFMALTAEEQGLLGSQYYADHPLVAPRQTVAEINMDGLPISGRAHDITVIGFGKSEMDDLISRAAEAQGRRVRPDPFPERGSFFRSDQFHFARVGVPVLYTGAGIDLLNGGEAHGRALSDAYIAQRYHKPQDEITPDWDMSGATEDLRLLYAVGHGLATNATWPQWRADAEFRAVRAAQGR